MNATILSKLAFSEDLAASLAAIKEMADNAKDPGYLAIYTNRAVIDLNIATAPESSAAWSELYLNTAHESAKLLLKARELVVITDGGMSQAYWQSDLEEWALDRNSYDRRRRYAEDYLGFIAETMPASCEFSPGSPDTEALCAALIKSGARQIDA